MQYPQRSLIQALMFLLGMYPLHEQQQLRWQDKVHVIGLLLAVLHFSFTIYSYKEEQRYAGYRGSTNPNFIVKGTIILERILAMLVPSFSIIGRLCYVRALERFWEKLHLFDRFLGSVQEERTAQVKQRILRANFLAGVFVVVCVCFNAVSFYLHYSLVAVNEVPRPAKIYFFNSATAVYSTGAMYIFTRIYGLVLRLECLGAFVETIWQDMATKRGEVKEKDGEIHERRKLLEDFIRDYEVVDNDQIK